MNVRVTNHAVERYIERVRPGLDFGAAKAEMVRLIAEFGEQRPRPEWLSMHTPEPDVWVAAGDVWIPCQRERSALVAPTVYCRGTLSDEGRARRNAAKAGRRAEAQRERRRFEHREVWT